MASERAPTSGTDGDWAEHVKTYNGFLWLLKFSGGASVITLAALYFFLAR